MFLRVGAAADVTLEVGGVAEQEGRQTNAVRGIGADCGNRAGLAVPEGEFAGAVAIAGDPKVLGIAKVRSELEGVLASRLA